MKGFHCPTCHAPLRVYRTRRPCAGRVVRYRRCPQCGYRAVTRESMTHARPPAYTPVPAS